MLNSYVSVILTISYYCKKFKNVKQWFFKTFLDYDMLHVHCTIVHCTLCWGGILMLPHHGMDGMDHTPLYNKGIY